MCFMVTKTYQNNHSSVLFQIKNTVPFSTQQINMSVEENVSRNIIIYSISFIYPRRKWEDNIRIDLPELGIERINCIQLSEEGISRELL